MRYETLFKKALTILAAGTIAMSALSMPALAKEKEEKDYTIYEVYWDDTVAEGRIYAVWEADYKSNCKIQLYKGTTKKDKAISTKNGKYDMTERILKHGTGKYSFTLQCNKTDQMLESDEIEIDSDMLSDLRKAKKEKKEESKGAANPNAVNGLSGGPGVSPDGWAQTDAGWKLVKNGKAVVSDWADDAGKWYHFNENGIMQTGWFADGTDWYFLGSDGAMMTGWIQDGGAWYFLGSNGVMYADSTAPDGCILGADGRWTGEQRTPAAQ